MAVARLEESMADNMAIKDSRSSKIKKGLAKRGRILFYGSCIFTVTGFLGRYFMGFELTSHFRLQYFLILLISAIVYGCLKKWNLSSVAICFLVVNGLAIAPWYVPEGGANNSLKSQPLRILFSNVHTSNKDYASLLSFIDKESPDIITLEEVDDDWVRAIKSLCDEYPFNEFCPRRDNFGIAVLSKVSLQNIQVNSFCETMVPSIVADVAMPESKFRLIITHPVPPASPGYYAMRNEQLAQIAEFVKNESQPCVLVGDLNLTMWSYFHEKLLEETGMKNARKGFGILPTWPTILPPLYIPLDHCLCSYSIQVKSFRTTDRIGSDHLPFVVDLMVPNKN